MSVPAHAQSANPASSRNVVPTSTSTATDEAERKQLFAAMLRNPNDLDTAFAYAELSARLGDLESAISTLERMLIFAPGLSRLQFELGVLYYRLGAYETAATYLRAVEAAPDVPPEAKLQAVAYLTAIDRRSSGNAFWGNISTGIRYQSNANAGPGNPNITLNGINFLLGPGAMGAPDVNAFASGALNGSIDLKNQGDRLMISLTGYGSFYRAQGVLNAGVIELKVGPEFNLGRFQLNNGTAGFYGIVGGALAGGTPYSTTLGGGASLALELDAQTRVIARTELRSETFYNSATRPSVARRSGLVLSNSLTVRHALTPDVDVFATAGLDRRVARLASLSNWMASAEVGVSYKFTPIANQKEPWTLGLIGGLQHFVADAPDPIFSATAVERTTRVQLQGKLGVPLPNGFSGEAVLGYVRSLSNYGLSVYDNVSVSIGLGKGF